MNGGSRGAWVVVLGSVVTAVACGIWPTFPDSELRAPRDAGVVTDTGVQIDTPPSMDAVVRDAVDVADVNAPDVPVSDLGDDVPKDVEDAKVTPVDADLCAMVPMAEVTSTRLSDGVMGGHDLTLDGLGRIVIGVTGQVVVLDPGDGGMGTTTPLVTGLGGEVRALRFTGNNLLVTAVELLPDGGDPDGNISVANALGGVGEIRVDHVARLGGVAVDRDNGVWFSNTAAGRVFRFVPQAIGAADSGVDAGESATPTSLVTDVTAPTLLAFSANTSEGNDLFVADSLGALRRATVTRPLGLLTVSPSEAVVGGLGHISGLAIDTCGNAYVADDSRNLINRVSRTGTITRLVSDVMQPRGLAFGQGGRFGRSTLLTISAVDGSLHAIETVAEGVGLPSP